MWFSTILKAWGIEEIKDIMDSTFTELTIELGCQNMSPKKPQFKTPIYSHNKLQGFIILSYGNLSIKKIDQFHHLNKSAVFIYPCFPLILIYVYTFLWFYILLLLLTIIQKLLWMHNLQSHHLISNCYHYNHNVLCTYTTI